MPVWAFAEIDGVVYVGGRFTQVRRGPGSTHHDQPFLAAFHAGTGEWISSFRPELDSGVYSLAASPDGSRLYVGGEFTNVNGVANTGHLVALDPATGQPDPTWVTDVTHHDPTAIPTVMDIEIQGDDVYVAGNFSHIDSQDGRGAIRRYRVARLAGADARVDTSFQARASGGRVYAIEFSPDGERLYLGGYFTSINGAADSQWFGAVTMPTGADVIANPDPLIYSRDWVFDLAVTEEHVYIAAERHLLYVADAETLEREDRYYANGYGGDYQAAIVAGGYVITGGHQHGWQRNTMDSSEPYGQVQWLSLFDPVTADPVYGFTPKLNMADGVWALHVDSAGSLWVGGDATRSAGESVRGFAVFGPHMPEGRRQRGPQPICNRDHVFTQQHQPGLAVSQQSHR